LLNRPRRRRRAVVTGCHRRQSVNSAVRSGAVRARARPSVEVGHVAAAVCCLPAVSMTACTMCQQKGRPSQGDRRIGSEQLHPANSRSVWVFQPVNRSPVVLHWFRPPFIWPALRRNDPLAEARIGQFPRYGIALLGLGGGHCRLSFANSAFC
jgi:hypothetical protein